MTTPATVQTPLTDPKYQFKPEDVDEVYAELGSLVIQLDQDPLAFGPKRLQSKVALVRRAQDRCTKLFLTISYRLQVAQRAQRIAATDYDLAKKHLFANDPETRSGRNIADREAIAAGKLRQEVNVMNHLTNLAGDLEAVLTVIKTKSADLRGTEGRLKDQLRLCQEEIGLGARWGSKLPPGKLVDLDRGKAVADADHIDELVGRMDGEIHLAQATGDWAADVDENAVSTRPTISEPGFGAHNCPPHSVGYCAACGEPQFNSPGGLTCNNGHGGAPTVAKPPKVTPAPEKPSEPVFAPVEAKEMALEASVAPSQGPKVGDVLISGDPKAMPGESVSQDKVDAYLEALPMEGLAKQDNSARHVAIDDQDLNKLLDGFESLV